MATGEPKPSIVLPGGQLRCPHCEEVGRYPGDFISLSLNEKYKDDLNPVYKHKLCGHVFSPGDPYIIQQYVTGQLVPRSMLEALQATVDKLQAAIDGMSEGRKAA